MVLTLDKATNHLSLLCECSALGAHRRRKWGFLLDNLELTTSIDWAHLLTEGRGKCSTCRGCFCFSTRVILRHFEIRVDVPPVRSLNARHDHPSRHPPRLYM